MYGIFPFSCIFFFSVFSCTIRLCSPRIAGAPFESRDRETSADDGKRIELSILLARLYVFILLFVFFSFFLSTYFPERRPTRLVYFHLWANPGVQAKPESSLKPPSSPLSRPVYLLWHTRARFYNPNLDAIWIARRHTHTHIVEKIV